MPNFYADKVLALHQYCISPWADRLFGWATRMAGICQSMKNYHLRQDADGNPLIEDCQQHDFAGFYASAEAIRLFGAFYHNHVNIADRYVDYWAYVSKELSDNPYVIGFDPFNEPAPSAGSMQELFSVLFPGNFDNNQLNPLYERINAKYMEASPSNIMYFEPGQFPDALGGYVFHVGFQTPPGGRIASPNHVLNDHAYCCALDPAVCADGEPAAGDAGRCLAWHRKKMGIREQDAERLGVPLLISEFGACLDSQACVTEIT